MLTAVFSILLLVPVYAGDRRPNFLVIVADDLGFSDIGAFGGEIDTPNLDALAYSGLRLTGFHTSPACSPTRAMLLTGSDNHRVGLGAMAEVRQDNQTGLPGFEGYLRADAPTLAERLSTAGYRTLFSGKWHLGMQDDQDPHARGFQYSFSLPAGGSNYFGRDFQQDPTKIGGYRENGVAVTSLPHDFYSTDYFATKLIEQIRTSKAGANGDKPFFAYLAFTAPHFPLQAPPESIAKYRGRYDAGFEALRAQRMKRQVELGLLDPSVTAHPLMTVGWNALSPEDQRRASRSMEIYAAMVDRLDQAVGRVVAALKETGEFDNTIIVFLSDNGAEGKDIRNVKSIELRRLQAESESDIDKLGSADSYVTYGPGWAQAATAPSWLYKTFATEGGTHTPAFIFGPIVKHPGTIAKAYLHVTDIVPTILNLAGIAVQPGTFADHPAQPIDGLSWKSFLRSGTRVYGTGTPVGNELFGSRSLRKGDWKITDLSDGVWHLFNIATDPGETRDLSAQEPKRKSELLKAWDVYAKQVGVTLPKPPRHPDPLMGGGTYSNGTGSK
jgi:arylsulfatase